jgi:hypothetical protein
MPSRVVVEEVAIYVFMALALYVGALALIKIP